jgi:hypothetical protein
MRVLATTATLILCTAFAGCATTKVETTGTSLKAPLCQSGGDRLTVVSFWQTKWRPDQKEPEARELAAERGIEDFFAKATCIARKELRRLTGNEPAGQPSDDELVRLASTSTPGVDRVLLINVLELGPKLQIGIPVIVEGGTEVLLEIRAIDAHTSLLIADFKTHWQNGGTLVVKGVKSLPSDMKAALQAALLPGQAAQ